MSLAAQPCAASWSARSVQAREKATTAARAAIHHLGVGEAKAPAHLTADQQALRRRLRAHGRQAGDTRSRLTTVLGDCRT